MEIIELHTGQNLVIYKPKYETTGPRTGRVYQFNWPQWLRRNPGRQMHPSKYIHWKYLGVFTASWSINDPDSDGRYC